MSPSPRPRPRSLARRLVPAPRTLLAASVTAVLVGLGAACGGDDAPADLSAEAQRGRQVSNANGCAGCHGTNGQGGAGPGWQGLYGSEVQLEDGSVVVADEQYLVLGIVDPAAQIHAGYQVRMPANDLDAEEVDAVIAYIRELGDDAPGSSG